MSQDVDLDIFHFDDDKNGFDDLGEDNGFYHYSARKLMEWLGYSSFQSFRKVINKAMTTCGTLNVPYELNFKHQSIIIDGKTVEDIHLSKFACYLIAMNGDSKKPKVAIAQAYFAIVAEQYI
jgi:DNA-damage-inducible protein D